MKKRAFLKILVALTVLSSILLSSILGITKAEYYKTLSKTLDFESKPDLMLEYYLYDGDDLDASTTEDWKAAKYRGKTGLYKNAESFTQTIVIGTKDKAQYKHQLAKTDNGVYNASADVYCGNSIVYQIKIPVDETGYYTLDFNSRFNWGANATNYLDTHFYTISAIYAVGCEVLTASDNINFHGNLASTTVPPKFDMSQRQFLSDTRKSQSDEQLLYADSTVNSSNTTKDSVYQWKTLCPSRSENVRLAFKVEQDDVERGYVIWSWDLYGLEGQRRYTLVVNSLSITKTMELVEDMKNSMGDEPYFVFPQTSYVNNNVITNGSNGPGYSRYSSGRGTYVTEATQNSLGMRAEMIYRTDEATSTATSMDNPIGIYIPLKNVKANTTYKVTFDFSVAKQGDKGLPTTLSDSQANGRYWGKNTNWHEYDVVGDIFESYGSEHLFQSYLTTGLSASLTGNGHRNTMDKVTYNDKTYQKYDATSGTNTYSYGYPLTKYDEVTKLTDLNHTTVMSVNNTFCNAYKQNNAASLEKSQSRNWFNAVQHTEYNGEYAINWITFYNTTFSFDISGSGDVNDLYWVWVIDSLAYKGFYNIRIDNVRIERVVQYSSYLDGNGVKIAGKRFNLSEQAVAYSSDAAGYDSVDDRHSEELDPNIFVSFRGVNGTGQNYQAKGFVLDGTDWSNKRFMADGNIYAPIIDAKKMSAIGTVNQPYQIALDGVVACKGGVNKYVFSIDGGKTWQDMMFTGKDISAASDATKRYDDLSRGVNQWTSGQTQYGTTGTHKFQTSGSYVVGNYTHIDNDTGLFAGDDGKNGYFSYGTGESWALVADLSEYKYMANLDIIIAAVPFEDPDMRCEILRIINFNQSPNYVSYVNNIYSDIRVKNAATEETNNLNASYLGREANVEATKEADNTTKFSIQRGWDLTANAPGYTETGYSLHTSKSTKYSDIRTLYSDISVKQWLGVQGWFFVSGDTRNVFKDYGWSVDGGVTWYDGSKSARSSIVAQLDASKLLTLQTDKANKLMIEARQTYENKWSLNHKLTNANQGKFFTGYVTKNTETYSATVPEQHLTLAFEANLADFEGQVVDIIFGGRAEGSDVYCPIAKIDNVAVYGETGTFYSRVSEIRTSPKSTDFILSKSNNKEVYPNKLSALHNVTSDLFGNPINLSGGWNKDIIRSNNSGKMFSWSYHHFETYNVNALNARLLGDVPLEVERGGRIFIKGVIFCNTNIVEYKYTLNGGVDWLEIPESQSNITNVTASGSSTYNDEAVYVDCNLGDTTRGNFTTVPASGSPADKSGLSFNLPALSDNEERKLLVVAVGENGKTYPIAHFLIKQKEDNDEYGYYRSKNAGATYAGLEAGGILRSSTWSNVAPTANTDGTNNFRHRISLPVNQVGQWKLDIQHNIDANKSSGVKKKISNKSLSAQTTTDGVVEMSVDKIHYKKGETITLTYKATGPTAKTTDVAGWFEPRIAYKNANGTVVDLAFATIGSSRTLTLSTADLPEGPITFYFINQQATVNYIESKGHTVAGEKNNLYAKITVTVHPADTMDADYATLALVRDASYYTDLDRQIDHRNAKNADVVTMLADITKPYIEDGTMQDGSIHIQTIVDITQEDVRRGFIILDGDYTHLYAGGRYGIATLLDRDTDDDENIDTIAWQFLGPAVPEQSQISLGGAANSEQYLQIPVDQTGTYKLKYSTVVGMGITKKGVNKIGINETMEYNGDKEYTYTNLNYGNASLSVSKNIFVEGEPITVTYNAAGSVCGQTFADGYTNNNHPWVGITTKDSNGKDRYVQYINIEAGQAGKVTFDSTTPKGKVEPVISGQGFEALPPGEYKIYLRDNGAEVYRTNSAGVKGEGDYWDAYNMVQPIEIKVVSKTNPDYTMSKSFSNSWTYNGLDNKYNGTFSETGSVTLNNTLFRIGEKIKLTTSNLSNTLKNSEGDWFALYPVNSNDFVGGCWQYVNGNSETSITIPDSLTPGMYRVVYLHGNTLTNAITAGAVFAEFYINIVPKDSSITASVESLDAQTKASMGEMTDIWTYQTTNEVSVSVTANDVTKGYVRIKFDVAGLPGNNYGCMLTVDDLSFLRQGD